MDYGLLKLRDTVYVDLLGSGAKGKRMRVPDDKVCVKTSANRAEAVVKTEDFGGCAGDSGESNIGRKTIEECLLRLVQKITRIEDRVITLE